MKKTIFLLCTTLSLWGWQNAAQAQNTTCETAQTITLGDTVTTPVQYQYRWYKFSATEGESYGTKEGKEINGSFYVYSSSGGYTIASGSSTFTFTAPATQDYYIRVYSYSATNKWLVTKVTDNRICAYAEAITLDDTVKTTAQYQYRWYKLSAAAGETYEVKEGNEINGYFYVYSSCGGNQIASGSSTFIFTAAATQDYYISVYGNNATNKWLVTRVTDNRLCAYPESIKLGDTVTTTAQYQDRWYKFSATAGKAYKVEGIGLSGSLSVYPFCGSDAISNSNFTAAATQDYYISVYGYSETNKWRVTQVTDNIICANADTITLGDTVTSLNGERWYKLSATQGENYEIGRSGMSGSFSVYSSCNGSSLSLSNNIFTAPATQDYYIRANGYNETNKWLVTKITDNRVCAQAEAITLGDTITTTVQSQERWYKLSATAGEVYEMGEIDGYFYVYSSCDGSRIAYGSGTFVFAAPATQDYYISAYGYGETNPWSVSLKSDVSSECSSAPAVSVDSAVQGFNTGGKTFWYKVTLEANALYLTEGLSSSDVTFAVRKACGDAPEAISYNNSVGGYPYTSSQAGEYLIGISSTYAYSSTWRVRKIVGNAICENATPVALNAKTPVAHEGSAYLWYRANVQAGKWYAVSV
ncbi:MAG: hypothetical protein LBB79_04060, partial [Prevotellaceae bacterium]|nr:hypothetical protein [Prevotellaceae bacterium]